jgi:hypothetical protein
MHKGTIVMEGLTIGSTYTYAHKPPQHKVYLVDVKEMIGLSIGSFFGERKGNAIKGLEIWHERLCHVNC